MRHYIQWNLSDLLQFVLLHQSQAISWFQILMKNQLELPFSSNVRKTLMKCSLYTLWRSYIILQMRNAIWSWRGLVYLHRMLRDLFYKTNVTICRQKQLKRAKINASLYNFTLITIIQTTPNISIQLKNASFVNYESKHQHIIWNHALRLSLPSCSRWNQGKNQKLQNVRRRKQEKEEATLPIVPNQTALPSLPNVLRWRRRPMENSPNLYLLHHWNFMCYSLDSK